MSSHYTVEFEVHIRPDIDDDNLMVLKYLLNAEGDRPPRWPVHPYFEKHRKWLKPINVAEGFSPNRTGASLEETGSDGRERIYRDAHVRTTSCKSEDVFENLLDLMQWLASLSTCNGFVGYAKCEEDDEVLFLLYVYDGGLYAAKPPTGEIHHFGTGAVRQISGG